MYTLDTLSGYEVYSLVSAKKSRENIVGNEFPFKVRKKKKKDVQIIISHIMPTS